MNRTTAATLLVLLPALGCSGKKEEAPPPATPPPAARAEPEPAPAVAPSAGDADGGAEAELLPAGIRALNWTAQSHSGNTVLRQRADVAGVCELRCAREQVGVPAEELWTASGCVGTQLDLRFVSEDCERTVVLHPLLDPRPNERAGAVAHVYKRGALDYPIAAAAVVKDTRRLQRTGMQYLWVKGVMGVQGERPRYTSDGAAVELEAIDGTLQRVPLVAAAEEPAPTRKRRRR